jgi:signal transduction histidine kinase
MSAAILTSAGIDPILLPRIFDLFIQAEAATAPRGGLGLGLPLVKALAELHDGKVQAFSEGAGRGTTVTVS